MRRLILWGVLGFCTPCVSAETPATGKHIQCQEFHYVRGLCEIVKSYVEAANLE